MRLIPAPGFFRYFVHHKYNAFACFPFIFLRSASLANDENLIRHEQIHLKQQKELGIILFYPIYLLEYLIGLIRFFNGYKAYRSISFEKEAYEHDTEKEYLNKR